MGPILTPVYPLGYPSGPSEANSLVAHSLAHVSMPSYRPHLSPPPPPPPCRNCKISIWHSPPRFETRLFNLIPAKSPDAGGCALTTLAVKSSTNRGPGEGLKSGSGEIVGPGSGTLLINPGIYWQAIGCKSAVHKRAIQLSTGQSSLEKETAEVKPTQAFSPNNYWQAIGCKSAVHKRAIQLSTGQSSLEKETTEVKPTQAFSPNNIYIIMINGRKISIYRFIATTQRGQRVTTLIRQYQRMTVKLHELAIKSLF